MPKIMRRQKQNAGFSPKVNILTLAAYERARRALRGECEPNSRAGKMRTNISNEPSANIVKMREVGSRPCRLRQNKKRPSKTVFLVEATRLELAISSTRSRKNMFFEHHCLHIVRIFREIISFCTFVPFIPYRTFPVVVSYVVKLKIRLKAENGELGNAFSPH